MWFLDHPPITIIGIVRFISGKDLVFVNLFCPPTWKPIWDSKIYLSLYLNKIWDSEIWLTSSIGHIMQNSDLLFSWKILSISRLVWHGRVSRIVENKLTLPFWFLFIEHRTWYLALQTTCLMIRWFLLKCQCMAAFCSTQWIKKKIISQ